MKKTTLLIVSIIIYCFHSSAQAPQSFKYQAVARDASGEVIANQKVGFQISILQGSESGIAVYTETHSDSTNQFGLITLEIGTGTTSDDFTAIDWGNDTYFIQIEMDASGGTSYTLMGTSQLLSVPYALHATTADSAGSYTETDPVFGTSVAVGITGTNIINWNNKLDVEVDGSITNEIELPTNALAGNMAYYNGTEWTKIPNGIDSQLLTFSNSIPAWETLHYILTSPNSTKYEINVDNNGNLITIPQNIDYYITISSPQINDNWIINTINTIEWTDNIDENLKIELYKDGIFHNTITSSSESDGSYDWLIDESLSAGNDYSIMITSVEKDTVNCESNLFTLNEPEYDIMFGDGTLPTGWTTSGAGWFITTTEGDGDSYSLQSGEYNMDDVASVSFNKTYNADGKLSFKMKRLDGGGIVTLYIDNDYVMSFDVSTDWKEFLVWIPSGSHTYKFETIRTSNSTVAEATFIDNISFLDGDSDLAVGLYYQGGIIFDINTQRTHGLICSSIDLDYNGNYETEWGCDGSYITSGNGADSESDGAANTSAIITDCLTAGIAARVCNDYSITVLGNTFNDWYLPSKNEIYILYSQKNNIANFQNSQYWSSTEYSSSYAWDQAFSNGSQDDRRKYDAYRVRAVRAF